MVISISAALATTFADAVTTAVDAGSGAATIAVYTGAKPATVATSATGTLLATFTLADPAAASAVAGVATLDTSPVIDATVAASGTPGWFRVADSDGTAVFDGEVGLTGGTEKDLNFGSVTWVSGGTVELTSATVTQPLT